MCSVAYTLYAPLPKRGWYCYRPLFCYKILTMKKIPLFITGLTLVMLACQALLPQTDPTERVTISRPQLSIPLTEADVSRIEVREAKAAVDSGQAILVDVRSADSYAEGHAAGAVSIPLDNFENNIDKLSLEKSQWIITYCT